MRERGELNGKEKRIRGKPKEKIEKGKSGKGKRR